MTREREVAFQVLLLCFLDNNATNSSFYAHCFDASRWSRTTFCFDFTLMITLYLVLAWRCCCNALGQSVKNLPYNPVDSFWAWNEEYMALISGKNDTLLMINANVYK